MYFKSRLFLMLSLCNIQLIMQAELLVVKRDANGFLAPLDHHDSRRFGKIISETILKYQWPMCITQHLTKAEQDTLLSSGVPKAEELFIQSKLRELIPADQLEVSVIFIPTSVYELFCILQVARGLNDNPFSHVTKRLLRNYMEIDFEDILSQGKNSQEVFKYMYDVYNRVNKLFFNHTEISAWLYINNLLADFLCKTYPVIKESIDGLGASRIIQHRSSRLGLLLIEEIYRKSTTTATVYSIDSMADELKSEPQNHILQKVIILEYEARELNKGLLLRGSSPEKLQVSTGFTPEMQTLAGTTLWNDQINRVEHSYRKKKLQPYSISFGNSLFAGFFNDLGACAYTYLTTTTQQGQITTGYSLFVDKKDYIDHRNSRLFFISALAPMASLFGKGEWFHSRTTVSVPLKSAYTASVIRGLVHQIDKDEAGVFLIARDPLYHAELFSQFLAENGRLIQSGDESMMTEEEQKVIDDIIKTQTQAALFYKTVRSAGQQVDRAIKKYVQKHKVEQAEKVHRALPFADVHTNHTAKGAHQIPAVI
ncbi:MAG TPA: hypothetical protein VLG50_02480 [Candidatus Saccharimonadales bacterium]|nr:hypothetical protein [Candidatus Saccharimonadales bacterium]